MDKEKRWKSTMHVEIAYEDGTREGVEGDVVMVFKGQAADGEYRPTLAVSGVLDVRALYGLLILLDMQLADEPDVLDVAIDTWRENRERLLQEAVENRMEVGQSPTNDSDCSQSRSEALDRTCSWGGPETEVSADE